MFRVAFKSFAALALLLVGAPGCTSSEVIKANSTPARQSNVYTPFDQLLDISIQPLDPGLPADPEEEPDELIIPDVRRGEAQFIAYQIKDTLELTGNWGAVRVTPQLSETANITMTGKILVSDGEMLRARIKAVDSTGRTWIDKDYEDKASKYSYERPKEDPFQDFYNKIADDLLQQRDKLAQADIANIRNVSSLRYAAWLSPDAFGGYVVDGNGKYTVKKLPAKDSAMLKRVDSIKDREYLFVDTLDDYYGKFYREMKPSYDEWRFATYDEAVRLRQLQSQATKRILGGAALIAGGLYAGSKSETWAEGAASTGAVIGGIGTLKSGLARRTEAEIHEGALKELSQSLGSEITPHVLAFEGRTIELTGTAEAQYEQWRKILKDIYVEETGLPVE